MRRQCIDFAMDGLCYQLNSAAFQRSRTAIPIDCGQAFQLIADSIPTIADTSSRRRLHGFT
jgi:hypothetical protein